jgi:hypothetical protein
MHLELQIPHVSGKLQSNQTISLWLRGKLQSNQTISLWLRIFYRLVVLYRSDEQFSLARVLEPE